MYDFEISNDSRTALKGAIGQEPQLAKYRNRTLEQAIALVVDALPDHDNGKVRVKVSGDLGQTGDPLEDREHTITITATSSYHKPEEKVELTPEEEAAGLQQKREAYQREAAGRQTYVDAGRHTINDKGEVTDVNALPVDGPDRLQTAAPEEKAAVRAGETLEERDERIRNEKVRAAGKKHPAGRKA